LSQLKKQFKNRNYTYKDFERAITVAMDKFKISRLSAMCELFLFMCSHGSVEDFKEYLNYFIENQNRM